MSDQGRAYLTDEAFLASLGERPLSAKQEQILGWLYTWDEKPLTITALYWVLVDAIDDERAEPSGYDWGWIDYSFEGLYASLTRLERRGLVKRKQVGSGGRFHPKWAWRVTKDGARVAQALGYEAA